MNKYEAMVIMKPELSEDDVNVTVTAAAGRIAGVLEAIVARL